MTARPTHGRSKEQDRASVPFLGLWDTVASSGLPENTLNVGWMLTLPPNVQRCVHPMALDEKRGSFPLTRVLEPDGSPIPA